jgi:hypothetical protein
MIIWCKLIGMGSSCQQQSAETCRQTISALGGHGIAQAVAQLCNTSLRDGQRSVRTVDMLSVSSTGRKSFRACTVSSYDTKDAHLASMKSSSGAVRSGRVPSRG